MAGLTQRALASRLGRVPSVVAAIELRQRKVDVAHFLGGCDACEADPLEVLRRVMKG